MRRLCIQFAAFYRTAAHSAVYYALYMVNAPAVIAATEWKKRKKGNLLFLCLHSILDEWYTNKILLPRQCNITAEDMFVTEVMAFHSISFRVAEKWR